MDDAVTISANFVEGARRFGFVQGTRGFGKFSIYEVLHTARRHTVSARTMTFSATVLIVALLSVFSEALDRPPIITAKTAPDSGEDWFSLQDRTQFQPAIARDPSKTAALQAAQRRFLRYDDQFIDGGETYYDEYAQAWRMIGMYIDCNVEEYIDDENNQGNEQQDNEADSQDGDDAYNNMGGCQRYLLWAAYIDLDYSGGGIGEYQYWDRKNDRWDKSACQNHGTGRCVKMDCHTDDTHFELLGYFKEPSYATWMEQLFKHEGMCVWTDEEYSFMQEDREAWPEYCTYSSVQDENGNYLYFHTKPLPEGRLTIGLYTDKRCSVDYQGSVSVDTVLATYYNYADDDGHNNCEEHDEDDRYCASTYELSQYLDMWHETFDVFHYCQPCKAYNLGYIPGEQFTDDARDYNGDDAYNPNEGYFSCYDDADYLNVNQCMKFATKTFMLTASFNDVMLAAQQGTIRNVDVGGTTYGTKTAAFTMSNGRGPEFAFLFISLIVFGLGGYLLHKAVKNAEKDSSFVEPLVPDGVTA